jgi:lactoylglutathione lyase
MRLGKMTTMSTILRCEIFPDDLDSTADFYTRVLGFELVADRRAADDPYLALQRDGVRIGAARRGDDAHPEHRRPPTGVELVLEVDDLAGELERVRRAGWPVAEELQSRPWGLQDFRVLDPSGYYLRITESRPA